MTDPKKPAQLTGNLTVDVATLAQALNPAYQDRIMREQTQDARPTTKIPCFSVPTGAKFTIVVEEGRNKKTGALEQVIKTLEDYEYPWSPELETVADKYTPPLRLHKDATFDWEGKGLDAIIHPLTHQLTSTAKQTLYEKTWQWDLRQWQGITVAQANPVGLQAKGPAKADAPAPSGTR
jgi:hypothetical protein